MPHEEMNHTPTSAGCLNPQPHQANTREQQQTCQTKPARVQTPNMTTKPHTEYELHDCSTNQGPHPPKWEQRSEPRPTNKTPTQVMTSPPYRTKYATRVQREYHTPTSAGMWY
ncbi:hypothetical protein BS47DRAFT_1362454 [Hydnum rufescens UP504]|uniref:Uncharacterized protein n=1 Tax=Hydnum rufescens UP504 TaxID=1448309 RepID=A0A9P6AWX3_9AGAM|nr:hypothetical protein BS47DRAFT_1362454 [Hydnum rufescens UP504]